MSRPACLAPMPRRLSRPTESPISLAPGRRASTLEDVPSTVVAVRVARWGLALARLTAEVLLDLARGRRSTRDRAIRLRRMLERMGGSAIKIGQQMSIRTDLLPAEVCDELEKLLDRVPPFPVEHAIDRIEAVTGAPLAETFEALDPRPIGSASIACVYKGILRGGAIVAVKVRRPGIRRRFVADLQALGGYLSLLERLTLLRQGMVRHIRSELQSMLLEEVDFELEARQQNLFRRAARKADLKWLTAPRIHPVASGPDVLTSDFVEGVPCTDLLAAVEGEDQKALARLEALGIHPRKVARRIMRTAWWGTYESPVFHADPHPANLMILPGSRLTLIDFGACGSTSRRSRAHQQETYRALVAEDPDAAAQALVHASSPLPPLDLPALTRRLRRNVARQILRMKDSDAEWFDKTSANLWLDFVTLSREFGIPVQLETIRMLRSTLLYDTIAMRLWPPGDLSEFRKYRIAAFRRARKRLLERHASGREGREMARSLQESARSLGRIRSSLRELTMDQPLEHIAQADKASYTVSIILRLVAVVLLTLLGTSLFLRILGAGWTVPELLQVLGDRPFAFLAVAPFLFLALRRIAHRLRKISS